MNLKYKTKLDYSVLINKLKKIDETGFIFKFHCL